jgi:hypothetical protein
MNRGECSRTISSLKSAAGSAAVILLLLLAAGCGSSAPGSPTPTPPPPPPPSPPPIPSPARVFPPPSGPSRTFVFARELSYPVSGFTRESRFVLYDNNAFVLEYPTLGPPGYRGAYMEAGGVVMFLFMGQGRTVDEPWDDATGTWDGDTLTVQYEEQNAALGF